MREFLTDSIMSGSDWRALELAVGRMLQHCGWTDVQIIGESGDRGADILAARTNADTKVRDGYLIQVKAVTGAKYVGISAVDQALQGQAHYKAQVAVVATNGDFTRSACNRRDELNKEGFNVRLWNGKFLHSLLERWPEYAFCRREMRNYQDEISQIIQSRFASGHSKCLFVIATGLGKTVIAASIADRLFDQGLRRILVLCHTVDLAHQLQKDFWSQLRKSIPTRIFMSGEPPVPIEGINFGLYQTLSGYLNGIDPNAFDLIIVDEAHHALASGFASCIQHLSPKLLIGMTATPWRGDGLTLDSLFGETVKKLSLVDGMRMGYLARVDYRLMCDNIRWGEMSRLSNKNISIRDLNRRMFVPQRDDAVLAAINKAMNEIDNPRIAIFSPTKWHADSFAKTLVAAGIPAANLSISDKVRRRQLLLSFATGRLKAITAVDVLNEGIDVPDVNMLVFLRATHSRRIFVQQLGRGLRIAEGKEKVIVLDFVTDVRRISAVQQLDSEAKTPPGPGEVVTVHLDEGVVTFNDSRAGEFLDEWLADVADLQDEDDTATLNFPSTEIGA